MSSVTISAVVSASLEQPIMSTAALSRARGKSDRTLYVESMLIGFLKGIMACC
jgi:hypothetical protein